MAQLKENVASKSDYKSYGTSDNPKLNENINNFSRVNCETSVTEDFRYYSVIMCVVIS